MDNVQETPVKGASSQFAKEYDSELDSGDEIFNDIDTVPTLPWSRPVVQQESVLSTLRTTQPTQLIDPGSNRDVLVPNSSPAPPSPKQRPFTLQSQSSQRPSTQSSQITQKSRPRPGLLASVMAPPGTLFRAPLVQTAPAKAQPVVIDSDDEGMPYVGDSSDDEQTRKKDIKPTVLKSRNQQLSGRERFIDITGSSYFSGLAKAPAKRRSESPGASSRPTKQNRQNGASKEDDMTLDDIEDFYESRKVARMRDILPRYSIKVLRNTLREKRGNVDDAMDYLANQEDDPIDLTTLSDGEDVLSQAPVKSKPGAKQSLQAPVKTIRQKFADKRPLPWTQPSTNLLSTNPEQQSKRKRLIRGRKLPSPPQSSSPLVKPVSREETSAEDTSSSAESEAEAPLVIASGLLEFFNTCSTAGLIDLASISKENAHYVLSKKPFHSLQQIRNIEVEGKKSSTARRPAKTLGEKVVDMCEEMWEGYEAIEKLLSACEAISRPVKNELENWGVDLFGASKDGSIDLISADDVDATASSKDSGLRTPMSLANSADEDIDGATPMKKRKTLTKTFTQPSIMGEGVQLKEYQKIGVEWLTLLYKNRLSCILADDMGLGKTCQVISFFARLVEMNQHGPHIVVVPASTLENWLREFQMFCPSMLVMPYYGGQKERLDIQFEIEEKKPYALVTTYDIAKKKDDRKFLSRLRPNICVFDEGHALKNSQTQAYAQLMKIDCKFRLLLTGTPLQNNLKELASLLGFIMPNLFGEHQEQLESIFRHRATTTAENTHEALLSEQRINKARSMMAPFVLRRKKHQVLKHIPPKTQRVEYCQMTSVQQRLYDEQLQRLKAEMAGPKKPGKKENVLMTLRQAAIHPWLFRLGYKDATLRQIAKDYCDELPGHNSDMVFEDLCIMSDAELYHMTTNDPDVSYFLSKYTQRGEPWMDSGKVEKLVALLLDYRVAGDRVLVFSQFKLVLDILEYVLETVDVKFMRLDGSTKIEERQELLDEFYAKPEITCFMLSTKAGGAGINLACANKVIVFDQSFNPQDDVQAENRAHRLGQTRPVEVVRLVTKGTVEEQILALGQTKLALDSRVAGEEGESATEGKVADKIEREGQAKVKEMLIAGET